ncbi:MAG: helix-turn-helix transcriptional regulator [Actinobacteria bacterium]|nr:helix-turn-helix transcriptional regulator [Actinomycetota bacterium]
MPESPATPTRRQRRREETRAGLIAAAQKLFARQSIEATAIAEITEAADVGFGSFYNYFDSKEEIAEAVLAEALDEQKAALFELIGPTTDPAESVALAHSFLIEQVRRNPTFGWLLVRLDASHRLMIRALGERARQDIRDGVKAGRFVTADPEASFFGTGGALLLVMRAVLDGELGADAGIRHCEGVLRMLGLPDDDAVDIARRAGEATAPG